MKPRLSLCMIVRNEVTLLPHCLRSVTGVADEVVVVDTGSTDGTQGVARRHGAVLVEAPWTDDFSAARNVGLEQARGDWILVMDADESLDPADRDKVRDLLFMGSVDAYFTTQVNFVGERVGAECEYSAGIRLFRNRPEYRYEGRIHERVQIPQQRIRVAPVKLFHYGYLKQVIHDREKRRRNLARLEAMAADQPDNPLLPYYLGC